MRNLQISALEIFWLYNIHYILTSVYYSSGITVLADNKKHYKVYLQALLDIVNTCAAQE